MGPARRGELTVEELPLPEKQTAEVAVEDFNKNWEAALAASKESGKPPKLMKVRLGGLDRRAASLRRLGRFAGRYCLLYILWGFIGANSRLCEVSDTVTGVMHLALVVPAACLV